MISRLWVEKLVNLLFCSFMKQLLLHGGAVFITFHTKNCLFRYSGSGKWGGEATVAFIPWGDA